MGFAVRFKERLDGGTVEEFERLTKFLKAFLLKEHNEDGTHIVNSPTVNTAAADNSYVTVGNTSLLSKERALTGTANQVTVTDNGANSTVQLGIPQNIHTGASPEFTNLTLSGLTASRLLSTNGSKLLASVANLAAWIAGTANQVTVTDDGDGTVTLSTPQDIHTAASPTFAGIRSNGATTGMGYSTGAGGTVIQDTSKSTGVTLNKVTGTITMHSASLAADTTVSFVLTNSAIAIADAVVVIHESAGTLGAYGFASTAASGSATIAVHNNTPGALAEAIVLRFVVIKSVNA